MRRENRYCWTTCGVLPGALPAVLQQLLQARQVVASHLPGCVLPLPLDLGADHLRRSLPALLQVAQHVPCQGQKQKHTFGACLHWLASVRYSAWALTRARDTLASAPLQYLQAEPERVDSVDKAASSVFMASPVFLAVFSLFLFLLFTFLFPFLLVCLEFILTFIMCKFYCL